MATCGDCAYFQVEPVDPMYGVCTVEAKDSSTEESASGTEIFTVKGKRVGRRDEACDKFKDRKEMSREERLRRGI